MSRMPEQNAASDGYLAGILDGEGCVRISRHKCSWVSLGYRFEPYVDITNTNKELLEDLQGYLGGIGHIHPKKMYHSNRKQGYVWTSYGVNARTVLLRALPYLRLKRQQAALVIEYVDRFSGSAGVRLSEADRLAQQNLFSAVRQLNKRGV